MEFKIIPSDQIDLIMPLVKKMAKDSISDAVLLQRLQEMSTQNYECVGVYDHEQLIGVAGMWFCTRHYSGRSVEVDHVCMEDAYRNQGLGSQLMIWIENYVREKGYETIELNTYVENILSHKFYHKQGYKKLGFHFLKSI
ncbi:MAG: GNAT family N-acetyltransferase [Flavobacteriaceae bacterium]